MKNIFEIKDVDFLCYLFICMDNSVRIYDVDNDEHTDITKQEAKKLGEWLIEKSK